jgi:hypothetical protein
MADFYPRDPIALRKLSACYIEPAMGEPYREGIEIHAKVKNLQAIGGANYDTNLPALLLASGYYKTFVCNEREAIRTYVTVQNALQDGATFVQGTSVNGLKKSARCYEQLPKEIRKNVLLFLSVAINLVDKPD